MATVAAPPFEARLTHWQRRHTLAVAGILAAIVCVGGLLPWAAGRHGDFQYARLAAWIATLGLFLGLAAAIGHGMTGLWRGVFVDDRHKLSLSRVQMFLWTVLVLSAYLTAALSNVGLGSQTPLSISVPQTLLQAMGLSTLSLVAAPAVLHGVKKGTVTVKRKPADSRWTDLVRGEETANSASIDLAKLQLLLVTIVLVLGYAVVLGHAYVDEHNVFVTSLPKIDAAFVVMLGISHVGYLATKTTPRSQPQAPQP